MRAIIVLNAALRLNWAPFGDSQRVLSGGNGFVVRLPHSEARRHERARR